MQKQSLHIQIQGVIGNFAEVVRSWEEWLWEINAIYLAGNFLALEGLHAKGLEIIQLLRQSYSQRTALLDEIRQSGVEVKDLRDALAWVHGTRLEDSQIVDLSQRLQRVRQKSLSMWILAFQCSEHTSQILQILSTGEAQQSTYGSSESESIGGGRLVNQAA